MNAIETQTIERDGQTFRLSIYPDPDAANPLTDWSEMGTHPEPEPPSRQFRPEGRRTLNREQSRRRAAYLLRARPVLVDGRRGTAPRCPLPV